MVGEFNYVRPETAISFYPLKVILIDFLSTSPFHTYEMMEFVDIGKVQSRNGLLDSNCPPVPRQTGKCLEKGEGNFGGDSGGHAD
jgi:hypothetical protein